MDRNVAVVGTGYWGKNLVRNFADLRALRCICDSDEPSLAAQVARCPGVRSTTRFEDVLADPEVRAVVIATPAALHFEHTRQALLHGKDVFVEKPLALRYAEGLQLVNLAKTRGAVLMAGHILAYHPAVKLLRDIVSRGELGRLWYVYSNRLNLGKVRQEENILWSFAPHDISVILSLVDGVPVEVAASGGTYLQSGIADVTVSNILFGDGVRAHIFVSWLHPYKEQKLIVIGDRKMAVFDDTAREGKLKIYDKGIEWRSGQPMPRQTAETTLFFEETEPLRLECEHFLECVRYRKLPLTDGQSALGVLQVLEASQRSLERGGAPIAVADLELETGA
jgi:UDP-2-acetamido-3-amino-2,3-dideoxy-glucuronate N-acetyltransferase